MSVFLWGWQRMAFSCQECLPSELNTAPGPWGAAYSGGGDLRSTPERLSSPQTFRIFPPSVTFVHLFISQDPVGVFTVCECWLWMWIAPGPLLIARARQ